MKTMAVAIERNGYVLKKMMQMKWGRDTYTACEQYASVNPDIGAVKLSQAMDKRMEENTNKCKC